LKSAEVPLLGIVKLSSGQTVGINAGDEG